MSELGKRLLSIDDLPRKKVRIDEWDTTLYVRILPAGEVTNLLSQVQNAPEGQEQQAILDNRCNWLVAGVVDEKGKPIWTPKDAEALKGKNNSAVQKLFDAVVECNNLGGEAAEVLEKNS